LGALRRLVFAEPAADDLEAIIDYIALDDPTAQNSYNVEKSCKRWHYGE
jgi:plasmid stabilization system protein ParE